MADIDLRNPQRDVNVKWVGGATIGASNLPVDIKNASVTLNVEEIAFGYVGIEDQLGTKLVINPDGSINTTAVGGGANVTVVSSVLPTGAALDATVSTGNTALAGVHTDTTAIKNSLAGTIAVSGSFWQATQPVSGTFWPATQPVSGTFWQATQPVSGTFWQGTQPISAVSLPLPAGAALDASIATTNTTLAEIALDTDILSSLGQALGLASVPVVVASDQTTLFDRNARRHAETQFVAQQESNFYALARYAKERVSTMDRRGWSERGSIR